MSKLSGQLQVSPSSGAHNMTQASRASRVLQRWPILATCIGPVMVLPQSLQLPVAAID
jgi:hypothetical protein